MADTVTKNDIMALMESKAPISASIYIKIYPYGQESKKNSIRLKKHLNDLEEQMPSLGVTEAFEENFSKAKNLLNEIGSWKENYLGLAIFISENTFSYYKLSSETSDLSMIEDYFYTLPLFDSLDMFGEYYVLDVSQNHNRLIKCMQNDCEEVEVTAKNWPKSIEDLPSSSRRGESLQGHPSGQGARQMHGQAKWKDKENEDVRDYFRMIDDELKVIVGDLPLIIATTKENFSIYKEQTRINNVMDDFVEGNHKSLNSKELAEKALELVNEINLRRINDSLKSIMDAGLIGERSTYDFSEIVKRSFEGSISEVFITNDKKIYGKFDEQNSELEVHSEKQNNSIELLNYIAGKTFLNGGEVFIVSTDSFLNDYSAAAKLRY